MTAADRTAERPGLAAGTRVGPYEVLASLGSGGMGEVYRARDERLGREVAIKVLPSDGSADPERLRRFELEARVVGGLNHPNLVAVFDVGHDAVGPYVVFELLEGKTLRHWLGLDALPPRKAVEYAIQIAQGLAAAHDKGIAHRDLKPDNLFITGDRRVKILDFGLAKLRGGVEPFVFGADGATVSDITDAGTVLGTVGYMSPEQVRGLPADHRSDIFAFGAVLYEMLSGRRAFRGESAVETMNAILKEEPPELRSIRRDIPPSLDAVVRHCLEKRPQDRFQSARDIAFALEAVAQAGIAGARGWPRPRPVRLATLAGAVALALLAVGGIVRFWLAPGIWSSARTAPMRAIPLTSLPGSERYPAFSPDGNHLAFSWDGGGGNWDIYVQLIGAGRPLRLTTDPADDQSPAWSPDGRYIAFSRSVSDAEQGIFVVPALGGAERKVQATRCPFSCRNDWSADGRFLAFTDQTLAHTFGISLVSVETFERRRLTAPPEEQQADVLPAFSPDGRWVAFAREAPKTPPIVYVVPVAGGEPRRVSLGDVWTRGELRGLTWTPDGGSIVASWSPVAWASNAASLWRVAASGGVPEQVAVGGNNAIHPSISRRGDRLAFVETHIDSDIWEIGISGSPPKGHSPRKVISSSLRDEEEQLSPDGSKIAFASDRSGSFEIWICDRDGANALQLTRDFGAGMPRWSPDGRSIAFDSDTEGQFDIYVLEVAGGLPRRLTSEASTDAVPSWSGDARWIYFGSNRTGGRQVWKVPPTGGPAIQVTRNGGFAAFESSDGSRLYYAKFDAPGIWTVPVNGGEERPVHNLPPTGYWGYWSIGRRGLYLVNPEAKPRPAIELFSLATRRVTRIAEMERQPIQWTSGFSVSRDERSILYSQWEQSGSDIMLVEDFR